MRVLLIAALACAVAIGGCGGSEDDGGGGSSEASGPGAEQYRDFACSSCHSLDGSKGTGPTFKGLAGKTVELEYGTTVTADADYLKRSITDPDAPVVEGYAPGVMGAAIAGFDLGSKPEDVDQLVRFIESVK